MAAFSTEADTDRGRLHLTAGAQVSHLPAADAGAALPVRPGRTDDGEEDLQFARWEPLIRSLARRMARGDEYLYEDLCQEGRLRVWLSLKRFDPTRGTQLSTYLHGQVRGAMANYLRGPGGSLTLCGGPAGRRLRVMTAGLAPRRGVLPDPSTKVIARVTRAQELARLKLGQLECAAVRKQRAGEALTQRERAALWRARAKIIRRPQDKTAGS